LELGGSDPFIVLADADLEKAVKWAVTSRMINAGQSCIAAKRFIVVEDVYEEFIQKATEQIKNLKTGDPENRETNIGPLARPDLLEELDEQVKKSVAAGAKIEIGGKIMAGEGYYYQPTLVSGVTSNVTLFREETFGPVLAVIKAKDEDDAICLANDSIYGLGGSLWTRDIEKGTRLARQVQSGAVFVNGMTKSDPRLPFGGIKRSGYGRELSHYGIKEFVNISCQDNAAIDVRNSELYTQQGCPACTRQEKLFGEFVNKLNMIDCTENIEICNENQITHTPTWIIDGEKYEGYQSAKDLRKLTGC